MTPEVRQAFAELRSLCQSTHNPKTWRAILNALKSWPDEVTLVELAVPYATDHLNHWPDHFRNCDEHALDLLVNGDAPLYMSVLTRLGNINIFADSEPGIPHFKDRDNWRWLSTNEAMTSIRSLNVRNHDLSDETLVQIAQSPHLSNLKHLDVGGNNFSPEGCANFAREMTQQQIDQLFVWGNRFDDEALHTLGQNPNAASITYFELGDTPITGKGLTYMANAPYIEQVNNLFLWSTRVDTQGLRVLCESQKMMNLTEMELNNIYELDHSVGELIGGHKSFSNLKWLTLNGSSIEGAPLIDSLANSRTLRHIERLGLSSLDIDNDALMTLLQSELMASVKDLEISYNHFSNLGQALHESPYTQQLEEIAAWGSAQEEDILSLVFHAPNLDKLREFRLSNTRMKYKYVKEAFDQSRALQIEQLGINRCNLGSNSIRAIAQTPFERLTFLSLGGNALNDKAFSHLANSPHMGHVTQLHMVNNEFTDESLRMLVDSELMSSLSVLDLRQNVLTEESVDFVLSRPEFANLKRLDLRSNDIDYGHMQRLYKAEHLPMSIRAIYASYQY